MIKATVVLVILTTLISFRAYADSDSDSREMRHKVELALNTLFQKLEKDKIVDQNPEKPKYERRKALSSANSNPDYRQALKWADELEKAGQISNARVSDTIDHMRRYKWQGSQCSMLYVYQILHGYNQWLEAYFKEGTDEAAAIAKVFGKITNHFADITSDNRTVFYRKPTQEDRKWKDLIDGAFKYQKAFCKRS